MDCLELFGFFPNLNALRYFTGALKRNIPYDTLRLLGDDLVAAANAAEHEIIRQERMARNPGD